MMRIRKNCPCLTRIARQQPYLNETPAKEVDHSAWDCVYSHWLNIQFSLEIIDEFDSIQITFLS